MPVCKSGIACGAVDSGIILSKSLKQSDFITNQDMPFISCHIVDYGYTGECIVTDTTWISDEEDAQVDLYLDGADEFIIERNTLRNILIQLFNTYSSSAVKASIPASMIFTICSTSYTQPAQVPPLACCKAAHRRVSSGTSG